MLRSSPAPEGRCHRRAIPLPTDPLRNRGDPHRPRRAGAPNATHVVADAGEVLRSSPAPEGRCHTSLCAAPSTATRTVAILTGPGGPVPLPLRRCRTVAGRGVAILTGPGGPV